MWLNHSYIILLFLSVSYGDETNELSNHETESIDGSMVTTETILNFTGAPNSDEVQNKTVLSSTLNDNAHSMCCKSREVKAFQYRPISLYDKDLEHATLETDDNGIVNFEMRFAVKSNTPDVIIELSPFQNPGNGIQYYAIGLGRCSNACAEVNKLKRTTDGYLKMVGPYIQSQRSPGLISPTRFTEFYIKINKGTVEVGRSDSKSPAVVVKYTNEQIRKVKYINFILWDWGSGVGRILYDCPPYIRIDDPSA